MRVSAALLAILVIGAAGTFAYAQTPPDRIAKGVSAGGVKLGSMTRDEATSALATRFDGMRLSYDIPGANAMIVAEAVADLNAAHVAELAFLVGRGDGSVKSAIDRMGAAVFGDDIPLTYRFDKEAMRAELDKSFMGKTDPATDAVLLVKFVGANPEISVTPEREGWTIDFVAVAHETEARIAKLDATPIKIAVRKDVPRVRATDVESFKPALHRAIGRAPITLSIEDETWTVSKALLADWLIVTASDGVLHPAVDPKKVDLYLESRGAKFSVEPTNATFNMKDGKVTVFVPASDGSKIDAAGTIDGIESKLFGSDEPKSTTIEVAMTVVVPKITTEAANPFGIKEIIGIGETNFGGSPKNRRHNIAIGAKSVHGTLIPPGEEFSLLKTLGTIDDTTGYLQELVIKGNKTTPEYGGGLCQIGSTAFRGALASGMLITARQNHSYRVPYYERDGDGAYIGPGKDATIYDPAPDFKFKNDTSNHILIQTAIKGDRLSFIFWGVKDGRIAEQTDSRVFNVVPPPEKLVTKTVDLAPGVTKCTERAHAGSDAVFTYTVTYPDGEKNVVDFKSRYRPWREVCLLGVTQAELDAAKAAGEISEDGSVIPQSADAAGVTGTTLTPVPTN